MCKSSAEGGQRCAGHAKTRLDTAMAKSEATLDRLSRGEVDRDTAQSAHDAVLDAMVDYTSTTDGAADYRRHLADGEAWCAENDDPEMEAANEDMRGLINDGALRAQTNREVENAYRATQGKPPLSTPVPQTLDQEADAKAAAENAAAELAAKHADPFGLRVEQASRGIAAVGNPDEEAAIIAQAAAEQAALEANPDVVDQDALQKRGTYIAALGELQNVTAAMGRGEADEDDVWDAQDDVAEALVDYASTNAGANDMYATLHALDPASPDYADQAEATLSIIDEGAQRAQANRVTENASRAAQGLPPLTTPVPQTLEQLEATAKAMSSTELATSRADMEAAGSKMVPQFDALMQEQQTVLA